MAEALPRPDPGDVLREQLEYLLTEHAGKSHGKRCEDCRRLREVQAILLERFKTVMQGH